MAIITYPGKNLGGLELGGETVNSEVLPRTVIVDGTAVPTFAIVDGSARPTFALVQDREVIDAMNAITGWTALDTDTTTIATATNHILGSASLSFAKANTAANSTFAGVEKTITSINLSRFGAGSAIEIAINVDTALVASAFIRLGTDSSNYSQWLIDDSALLDQIWDFARIPLFTGATDGGAVTGTGWDMSAITYASVGINFDLETNALAGILFDHLAVVGAQMTVT